MQFLSTSQTESSSTPQTERRRANFNDGVQQNIITTVLAAHNLEWGPTLRQTCILDDLTV